MNAIPIGYLILAGIIVGLGIICAALAYANGLLRQEIVELKRRNEALRAEHRPKRKQERKGLFGWGG